MGRTAQLMWHSLAEAAELVRTRAVSPVELTRACVDRIERVDAAILRSRLLTRRTHLRKRGPPSVRSKAVATAGLYMASLSLLRTITIRLGFPHATARRCLPAECRPSTRLRGSA